MKKNEIVYRIRGLGKNKDRLKLYRTLQYFYIKTIKRFLERKILIRRLKRNCEVYFIKELINKNTWFPHPIGIVISIYSQIGFNCWIYQNVSIGTNKNGSPVLKDNVKIYPNCVLIGKIIIGDNSIICAGSVVLNDVPKNEMWAGNPAIFIKKLEDGE